MHSFPQRFALTTRFVRNMLDGNPSPNPSEILILESHLKSPPQLDALQRHETDIHKRWREERREEESTARSLSLLLSLHDTDRAVLVQALQGRDIIARGKKGTGKTLAFSIHIIKHLTEQAGDYSAFRFFCCDQMLAVVRRLWSRFLRISHRRDKTCFFFKNYAYFDEEVGEEVPSILCGVALLYVDSQNCSAIC
ncbi:hypothetical protein YC2023_024683 [Brassica napus]